MTGLWTDDDVAELFASANPVPTERREGAAGPIADPVGAQESGGVVFDLADRPLAPVGDVPRERWWLVAGVAAAVALVVSLLVTTTVDDEPEPADVPAPTVPGVESNADVRAYEFVAALNSYDVEAASASVAPGAPIAVAPVAPGEAVEKGITLDGQIAWRSAWGWQWDDPTCRTSEPLSTPERVQLAEDSFDDYEGPDRFVEFDTLVLCDVTQRSRVGDLAGQSHDVTVRLRLLDGRITFVEPQESQNAYIALMRDFVVWARAERADEFADAWNDEGPLLTVESAEVERRLLDEYVALNTDDLGLARAHEFIAALNDGDVDAARAVLVPDHEPELVQAEGTQPTLHEQFAWLQAFGVTWEQPECSSVRANLVACSFAVHDRLTDARGDASRTARRTASFTLGGATLEMNATATWWPDSYDRFIYWVNANDREVAHQIWVDGDSGQIVTEETARLVDEQLTAYIASGALALESSETEAQRLVDALNDRDANALDAAATPDLDSLAGWERSTWPVMLDWMEANGEEWHLKACHPVGEGVHGCEIEVTDALSAGTPGAERPLFATLVVREDRIADSVIWSQSDDYVERALLPFLAWLEDTHPDEIAQVWHEVDGEMGPLPTTRAAELHAAHLEEYLANGD